MSSAARGHGERGGPGEPSDAREPHAEPHWQALQALSWSTFHFTLPRGWEVTAYLLRAHEGQLQFHQREAFMAQLEWRTVAAPPDLTRTLEAAALQTAGARASASCARPAELALTTHGAFLLAEAPDGRVHACTYQAETKLLIHWIFPFAEHVTRPSALGLLDSYALNAGPCRVFQIFGVGVQLPHAFALFEVRAQPADVTVHWLSDKGRHLVAKRIGMDSAILAQRSLAELAEDALRRDGAGINAIDARPWQGHPGIHTRFVRRAERGLDALIARPSEGESRWWHDEREGRIYALTQWGPSGDALVLPDVWTGAPRAAASMARAAPSGMAL